MSNVRAVSQAQVARRPTGAPPGENSFASSDQQPATRPNFERGNRGPHRIRDSPGLAQGRLQFPCDRRPSSGRLADDSRAQSRKYRHPAAEFPDCEVAPARPLRRRLGQRRLFMPRVVPYRLTPARARLRHAAGSSRHYARAGRRSTVRWDRDPAHGGAYGSARGREGSLVRAHPLVRARARQERISGTDLGGGSSSISASATADW